VSEVISYIRDLETAYSNEMAYIGPDGITCRSLPFGTAAIVARVYKGESWFDRKECIILDYSQISLVAGWIRDEIRMIKPSFYLGLAFGGRAWLFRFALQF
jgi:hypothetical protein